jgi:hypothetical protein
LVERTETNMFLRLALSTYKSPLRKPIK